MSFLSPFTKTKTRIAVSVVVLLVIVGIIWKASSSKGTDYQLIPVTQGAITQTVSVTGNTTSTQSVSLAFQNGGEIANVYKNAGDEVQAGDIIATLSTGSLEAQLEVAQANLDEENAKLQSLEAGPTTANVAVSQANLASAQQALQNAYFGVANTVADAYAKSNDAVRNQLSSLFSNGETNNPVLNVSISDSQTVNNAEFERIQASTALNSWQAAIASTTSQSPESSLDVALQTAATNLSTIKQLLTTVSFALTEATNLSASTATAYQNEVTAALNEVSTASTNVANAIQNIATQKSAVAQSEAQLNLTLASSTPQDIAEQQAAVESAQASVASAQVSVNQASLVSPINGVVTQQNAKPGQIASPGVPLTYIITDSNFEVDAYIPEIDVGQVAVGNPVTMTFDAFPNETFSGTVSYINPAETDISGVVEYEIKISFAKADPRMKSGLTADCEIQTQTVQNALILPQYAVLQNDSGTFVEYLSHNTLIQTPVILGIQDASGDVQIASGVTNGEQVVNIGLKTQ